MARLITLAGLALCWSRAIAVLASGGDTPLPAVLGQTGFLLAAAGCLGLMAIVKMLFPPRGRLGFDSILGLCCAATGLFGVLLVFRDEGVHVGFLYSIIIAIALILGGIALALVSVGGYHRTRRR